MNFGMTRTCASALACLGFVSAVLAGQRAPENPQFRVPMVQDWTHRQLIYSAPRSLLQNLEIQQQPRYFQQYLRRNIVVHGPMRPPIHDPVSILRAGTNGLYRDWGISAGNGFTMGIGNFPAKYTFNANATLSASTSCTGTSSDYVVFTTNQGTGLDIYAANNLYVNSGGTGLCSGTNPNVMWAYHIQSNGGNSITSPVLSLDGTEIAWVESETTVAGTAALHILKPYMGGTSAATDDGSIATPNTPTVSSSATTFQSCTPSAPTGGGTVSHACLFNIAFGNAKSDSGDADAITPSSPYYDYSGDYLFVGDDAGDLHMFTNVFKGRPAEVTTGGWPVAVSTGDANPELGSPVFDETSLNVFVGDMQGIMYYVLTSASSKGACASGSPPCVGSTSFSDQDTSTGADNTKIAGAPIVDSTTQRVFVFFAPEGGGSDGAEVGQDDTTLTAANQVTANVGTGTAHRLNPGALDNQYYTSDNGASMGTGYLYVCGNGTVGGVTDYAILQRVHVMNGTMSNTPDTTTWQASNGSARCSPVSEFYNANSGVDYIFFSVEEAGAPGLTCAGDGCLYAATVTGGTLTDPGSAGTGALSASGGTSGIIIDNDSGSTGAASTYFTWLANGTTGTTYTCNGVSGNGAVCAVKATQSGLD